MHARDLSIRSSADRLAAALRPIESVFCDAGTLLASAVVALRTLTEGFAGVAGRMEDDDSAQAFAVLGQISAQLGQFGEGSQASEARLDAMQQHVSALYARIERLRKTIGEVRLLAINAKVEAAHISARDVDFTVFTQEIGRLAGQADDGLGLLAGELAGVLAGLQNAKTGLTAFSRDYGRSLLAVSERLGRGLALVAQRRQAAAESIRTLGELSSNASGRVARAVQALQIGDITRQRAEHVCEALNTLADVLDGGHALTPEQVGALVATVSRLQAAQARQGGQELERERERIEAELASMAGEVASLPARFAAIQGSGSGSSFLQDLGHELEEVHALLRRYAEARSGVDQVVSNISEVVAGMIRHVEAISGIEADMRVMGLNATFKCARLGSKGMALSVIAQELRGYSNRTAEDGRGIMTGLNGLIATAKDMQAGERVGERAVDMGGAMADAVRTLEIVGEGVSRTLSGLSAASTSASGQLQQAAQLLRGHPEFADALAACAATLEQMAEGGGPVGSLDAVRDEVLELLRGRYTMESERRVHEMLGEAATAAVAPATGPDEVDVDDLLF